MITELPTFKGWTVDVRLRQFRKADPSLPDIVFLEFDEEEGDELLGEYVDTLDESKPKDAAILEQINSVMRIN